MDVQGGGGAGNNRRPQALPPSHWPICHSPSMQLVRKNANDVYGPYTGFNFAILACCWKTLEKCAFQGGVHLRASPHRNQTATPGTTPEFRKMGRSLQVQYDKKQWPGSATQLPWLGKALGGRCWNARSTVEATLGLGLPPVSTGVAPFAPFPLAGLTTTEWGCK